MRYIALACLALALAGCYTPGDRAPSARDAGRRVSVDPAPGQDVASPDAVLSARQEWIIAAAREVLTTQSTTVGDRTYTYDCTGTILTIFAHAGVFLIDLFPDYSGNGVARLHGIASDYGLLHNRATPEPGDLVFWDNTYDRNLDGSWNDPLTHAGIVLAVDEAGTVEYVHHNYRRGIVTARMNLAAPEVYQDAAGGELNSPMRMASQRSANPDLWLSSHLFREFASLHRIELQTAGLQTEGLQTVSTDGGAAVASAR